MAKPSEKLAESLEVLHQLQERGMGHGCHTLSQAIVMCQYLFDEQCTYHQVVKQYEIQCLYCLTYYGKKLSQRFTLYSVILYSFTSILIQMAMVGWGDS